MHEFVANPLTVVLHTNSPPALSTMDMYTLSVLRMLPIACLAPNMGRI